MSTFNDRLANEYRHLVVGPTSDEMPGGLGTVRFNVSCDANAEQVIGNAKEVLIAINRASTENWPTDAEWREILPDWFVDRCSPELSQKEAELELERRRKLSPELRTQAAEEWSLLNWLYWFEPKNRHWYWWDATPLDDDRLILATEVDEWPFPWGSLSWLFRASGAKRVEAEE